MSTAIAEKPRLVARVQRTQSETSINMRISRQALNLIDHAADLMGKSRTEFVLESARRDAIDVLLDRRLFTLDAAQYDAFAHALDNPPVPGPKLKALMRRKPAWAK